MYKFKVALFTHKILNDSTNIPTVFHRTLTQASEVHTYNTRFAANLNFHRPKVNNNYGSSTFSFVASKFWEIIPTDLKKLPYTSFYKQYKLYLLNTQYYSFSIISLNSVYNLIMIYSLDLFNSHTFVNDILLPLFYCFY